MASATGRRICQILLAGLLTGGCASSGYRPYTEREKTWLAHAVTAQALDATLTGYALANVEGAAEANPLYGPRPDIGFMVSSKTVLLGAAYLVGQVYPDSRESLYRAISCIGYGLSAWNLGIIVSE